MATLTESGIARLFQDALRQLQTTLRPERALILFDPDGVGALEPTESFGVVGPWRTSGVSLTLIDRVVREGMPLLSGDLREDPEFAESSSALITGIRSVLCVPLQDKDRRVRGVLYADDCRRAVAFSSTDLMTVCSQARDLEHRLWQLVKPVAPDLVSAAQPALAKPPPLPPARRPAFEPPRAPKPAGKPLRLSHRNLVQLMRSLPVLVNAGIPLSRAFAVLGQQEPVARQILVDVEQGNPLWVSMQRASPSFTNFQLKLIKVGESSGSLVEVLFKLADHEERRRAFSLKLRSALTYPAVLFVACLAMIFLAPPFLLKGQLKMLDQVGGELPLLTRLLFFFSDGRFLVGLGAAALLALVGVGSWLRTPRGHYQFDRMMLEMPRLGRLWRTATTTYFAQALELQLRAGVSLLEAVPAAGAATGSPVLEGRLKLSLNALREGASLDQALGAAEFFPRSFLSSVMAGEESGRVVETLEWLARLSTVELEAALETAAAALEPLMMLAMGIMGGLVMLGTLLPMVKLVQNL